MATTMRAWRYTSAAGGLEKHLKLETVPKPTDASLTAGQLLIRTLAVSLNPADYKLPEMPLVGSQIKSVNTSPCMDFSGVVAAVHPSTKGFSVGQKVSGRMEPLKSPKITGALSEFIVASTKDVTLLPEGVSPIDAAGLPTTGLTAYQSLVPYIKESQHLFVNGGSGGVGNMAIQIGKLLGAHVTVSCSAKNVSFCKELGADEVLDYTSSPVLEQLKAKGPIFDLTIDLVGSESSLFKNAGLYMKPYALYILVAAGGMNTLGFATSWATPRFLGGSMATLKPVFAQHNMEDLGKLVAWVQEGKLRVVVDSEFGWEDAVKAFQKSKSGRAVGKVIIKVANE